MHILISIRLPKRYKIVYSISISTVLIPLLEHLFTDITKRMYQLKAKSSTAGTNRRGNATNSSPHTSSIFISISPSLHPNLLFITRKQSTCSTSPSPKPSSPPSPLVFSSLLCWSSPHAFPSSNFLLLNDVPLLSFNLSRPLRTSPNLSQPPQTPPNLSQPPQTPPNLFLRLLGF